MMILLGNMVYYGQSGFADSQTEQTATTVENNNLKQVVESPTAGSRIANSRKSSGSLSTHQLSIE